VGHLSPFCWSEGAFNFQLVQQQDGISEPPRESKLNAGGFSINTRLQPGAKAEPKPKPFQWLSCRTKLLKQFVDFIAAQTPGSKPGVNGNKRPTGPWLQFAL
jgi:hypothetical protein